MRRVINKDEVIVYEFLVPKKENLDGNQVRLMSCGILPSSSPGVGASPGFPGLFVAPPGFLFLCGRCSESEDSVYLNLGIQHSKQPVCYLMSFFCIF